MSSADTDVKKAAELKLWLEGRIAQLQEEIGRLNETLGYVDATLRATTFKPAIELLAESKEVPEVRELKRDKGGDVIAVATITSDAVAVEPSGVVLKATTPPFKSFLLGKILEGMKAKDEELERGGKLAKGGGLKFDVEEVNGSVGKLIIENYRDKARLNEILNTVSWTFSRMLEK
ncbi:MAG: hypothetical protein JRM74_04125 [Nitrososphaerota archaeon]|jgi:hypothetical protein|nr:hypothetical protein [Nitrososphaerota archaeon]MDG6956542.1 hypothetical protein [Nitrososphaerota archaeon]MDG6957469.1 hypothetical protein [Nitrososphaerota archaeon]MDG6959718.1 hypothetical protein [Nitrososphaerota archaeon]MDG6968082.1 hypothetical protein [Nitrososphaerota archaeon]